MSYRCFVLVGISLLYCTIVSAELQSSRVLSVEERAMFQRRIDDVYWQHRIWPVENPGPKPDLDSLMAQSESMQKVVRYLQESEALEKYWGIHIEGAQIQWELNRIIQKTRDPEFLREIFTSLNHDPFLISECLVRPILIDRQIRRQYSYDPQFHGELRKEAEKELSVSNAMDGTGFTLGRFQVHDWVKSDEPTQYRHIGEIRFSSEEWKEQVRKLKSFWGYSEVLPTGRFSPLHEDENKFFAFAIRNAGENRITISTVVWDKVPFDVWWKEIGFNIPIKLDFPSNSTYTLDTPASGCALDTWAPTPAPVTAPRMEHTALWTGTEMIIWGGNTAGGFRYNPATDSWATISAVNAPTSAYSSAVWTGTEMIVWGGIFPLVNTGARYDPTSDTWTTISSLNAPSARLSHTAIWTGSQMIVWGGLQGQDSYLNTGGRYDASTDTWLSMSSSNAPSARTMHTAVWTGSVMLIWGGSGGSYLSDGARYDPALNTWTTISATGAPSARHEHSAIWTGSRMVVWGGTDSASIFSTGALYEPSSNSWTAMNTSPIGRYGHSAVWTGTRMIVWGGRRCCYSFTNTGAQYDPSTNSWTSSTNTTIAPAPRMYHSAVYTGSEMIVWGGQSNTYGDIATTNSGARYNPSSDTWVATDLTNAPTAREWHTAIWTGAEMIIWAGDEGEDTSTGARYHPVTDSWSATSMVNVPIHRSLHAGVWTGTRMIVWGGRVYGGPGTYSLTNTGGLYDPSTDVWSPMTTANAPNGRTGHTAVWTGSEMIVWGADSFWLAGGRYDPASDQWSTMSIVNSATRRSLHASIWTGSRMAVWGGYGCKDLDCTSFGNLDTGGLYDPVQDVWTSMSATNAPPPRQNPTGVWTGTEMIVWGGYGCPDATCSAYNRNLNTGGRYNPLTDTWISTSTYNAPVGRSQHTSVWTDTQMIVWAGIDQSSNKLNSGGRYIPSSDSWTFTSTTNAPQARFRQTAVWTGDQMIIWGGKSVPFLRSGGLYCFRNGDDDVDGVENAQDCRPSDPTLWSIPGEATDLHLIGNTLSWNLPADLGGTTATIDVVRSTTPSNFNYQYGYCVASNLSLAVTSAVDNALPASGYYYLVNVENACGHNPGFSSVGIPRPVRSCP